MINTIKNRLVERGNSLIETKPEIAKAEFAHSLNELVCDLEHYPHGFVLGCIADRQIKAERAWMVPFYLKEQIGSFEMAHLEAITLSEMEDLMRDKHRLWPAVAKSYFLAIKRIRTEYGGDASRIWSDNPSSAEVVYRFLQFDGVGPKIATMAANILVRDFKVPMSDYYSIDISVDVHVSRVFQRLGLVDKDASNEQIIYRARSLHPEFPGLMDYPSFEIGRNWCKPDNPNCAGCYMNDCCLSSVN
ncbi:MAG: iron-sulfur cluster loop [Nitrospirae bacterium]|nr:iron-sulfur cluster loop [Nitrospirota bacterium]